MARISSQYVAPRIPPALAGRPAAPGSAPIAAPRFWGGNDRDVFVSAAKAPSLAAGTRIGLKNGRQIAGNVLGSAQISAKDLPELQRRDVQTVISFRKTAKVNDAERRMLESAGITFVNIGVNDRSVPKTDPRDPNGAVKKFLDVIADPKNGNVLIHCQKGQGRTGTFSAIARARELYQQGDPAYLTKALAEARQFGLKNKKQIEYAKKSVQALVAGQIPGHTVEFGSTRAAA